MTSRTRPAGVFAVVTAVLGAGLLSVPLTVVCFPLWSWFESRTGIEAVGHSGPAGWCYATTFAVALVAALMTLLARRR
jgi:hypothetical protein